LRVSSQEINKHDLTRLSAVFASDYIWHAMDGRDVPGEKDSSHISTLRFIFSAISDINYSIENIISENDLVAVNTKVMGTAKSEYFGFPPSLKKIAFKQMFFFRLSGKKIIEEWEVLDMAGIKGILSK
jgi:predicted ester cyclase